ncbi:MAG TPA: hypothetical protein VN915_07145 [Elusimicrobiota bacterium]|nr:hypothetical protein [Elusimicrobiota bacterium]
MQNKVRNAVIIIVLCLIGAYKMYKPVQNPTLAMPPADEIRDAVAGNSVGNNRPTDASLHLSNTGDDQLRDSVAGNAIPGTHQNGAPHGNTEDQTPPPPRGGDHNGIGGLNSPNPGSQLPPGGGPLSPAGPTTQQRPL